MDHQTFCVIVMKWDCDYLRLIIIVLCCASLSASLYDSKLIVVFLLWSINRMRRCHHYSFDDDIYTKLLCFLATYSF